MTVERISFRGGLPIVHGEEPKMTIAQAMGKGKSTLVSLPAGEYDITPPEIIHNTYTYNLIVKADGTGVCRMIPVFPNSVLTELDSGEQRMGGRQVSIAPGFPSMIIAGPNERGVPLIYECLIYNPGKSPEA